MSDFSAVHGIRDVTRLPAATFFRMAYRLPAYQGVMQARVLAEQQENVPAGQQPSYSPQQAAQPQRDVIPATQAAIQSHPELAGIFSFGTGSG